jgi:hypothetical protein
MGETVETTIAFDAWITRFLGFDPAKERPRRFAQAAVGVKRDFQFANLVDAQFKPGLAGKKHSFPLLAFETCPSHLVVLGVCADEGIICLTGAYFNTNSNGWAGLLLVAKTGRFALFY